jgi:hypothetical protein
VAVVVAHAEEGAQDTVLRRLPLELGERLLLAERRRELEAASQPDRTGYRLLDELVERREAERREHRSDLCLARSDVSRREVSERLDAGLRPGAGFGGR